MIPPAALRVMPSDTLHTAAWKAAAPATYCRRWRRRMPLRCGRTRRQPLQELSHVRTCVAVATFTGQGAMMAQRLWGLPLRHVSTMAAGFT